MVYIRLKTDHSVLFEWKNNDKISTWYISYGNIYTKPFTVYRPNKDIHNDFYLIHIPLELDLVNPHFTVSRLLKLQLLQ
jgi:hypothetical protein